MNLDNQFLEPTPAPFEYDNVVKTVENNAVENRGNYPLHYYALAGAGVGFLIINFKRFF